MKKSIDSLMIGEMVSQLPVVLKSVQRPYQGLVGAVFADKTGEVTGEIPESLLTNCSLESLVSQVVMLSASILVEKRRPKIHVTEIRLAQKGEFNLADVFVGIDELKKQELIASIKDAKGKVTNKAYAQLLNVCLSDQTLEKLSLLPATLGWYGCYRGGALVSTCTVTYMAMSSMSSYTKRGNGITNTKPDWSLLITAALLHCYGRIDFFSEEDAFKKSAKGMSMQYFSTLQHSIESAIYKNQIQMTDMELANLLNVLAVSVSARTDVKAVSKEGSILRMILRAYAEADQIDWQLANQSAEDEETEYYFSSKLNRYILSQSQKGDE